MKFLKPRLISVLRDKTANNLVVAIIIGTALSFAFVSVAYIGQGMSLSQWWSQQWRQLIGLGIAILIAELISRLAKR